MRRFIAIILVVVALCLTTAYAQDNWELRIIIGVATPGQAQAVANYSHYALVADMSFGLSMFDISDPGFPISLGQYNHGGIINDLVIEGNLAYLSHWNRGNMYLPSNWLSKSLVFLKSIWKRSFSMTDEGALL